MKKNKTFHATKISFFLALSFCFTSAHAAKVLQVKNNKVLIDLEGDSVSENDEFFLINPANTKKSAIVVIKQVKNGKALAEISKGKGAVGFTLMAKGSASRSAPSETASDNSSSRSASAGYSRSVRPSWGFVGEYIMASMETSFTRTTPTTHTGTSSMKGTGFGAGLFYNYVFSPNITVAAEGSLQQFVASGSTAQADCNNSTTCDVNILYLSTYGIGRYYFSTDGAFKMWGGGGAGFLLAMSKSSSVLNTGQISTNQVFSLAFGGDYHLNRNAYIPFSLQYDMFPSSSSVKATTITLRVGYAWNL